jgi:hypothetical protein
MPDTADLQMIVYAAGDEDRARILDVLGEGEMTSDWGSGSTPTSLDLGHCYGKREAVLGANAELVDNLRAVAPTAVFEVWQDPYGSTGGEYIAHVPGIGTYTADCDGAGEPYIHAGALTRTLSESPEGTTIAEWLSGAGRDVLGTVVRAALKAHKDALAVV